MSKRAEEAALKAYPYKREILFLDGFQEFDRNSVPRTIFQEGYEQAEKDCALIPEDIKVIFYLVRRLQYKYSDISGCFEEALELFNEARRKADGNEA